MRSKVLAITFAIVILTPIYASAETASVNFQGTTVDVEYTGQNVSILGIQPDMDFFSLIIDVEVSGFPAILEITLERNFIDSMIEGEDEPYIVLEDGFDIAHEEIETTADHRTLRIGLSEGTEEIEIIGTEFGEPKPEAVPPEPPEEPAVTEPEEEPKTPELPEEPPVTEPKEEPKETPKEEKPEEKTKEVECDPGTVLKNGVCVVPEECGPGTVFKDGQCVTVPQKESTSLPPGRALIMGIMGAFILGGTVAFLLWLISRGSRTKPNTR